MSGLFFGLFLVGLHALAVGELYIPFDSLELTCLFLFLAIACLLFALLGKKRYADEERAVFPGFFWLGLFFAWGVAGFFFSVRAEASFPFVAKYLAGIVLLMFLHRYLRSLEQLRRLFWLLALVAALEGVLSWVLQAVFPLVPGITRNFLFFNSNFRGNYLLFPLAMAAGLYLTENRRGLKWGAWSLIVLIWAQFGFIGSRGSYVAAGIVVLVLTGGLLRKGDTKNAGTILLGCLAGWLTFRLVFLLLANDASTSTLDASLARSPMASSLFNRELFWDAAIRIFLDHPLTGSGSWTFPLLFPYQGLPPFMMEIAPPRIAAAAHAHNLFLQTLAEMGLIGFTLLIAALIYFYRGLLAPWRGVTEPQSHLALCLMAGMAGYLAHNLIETMWPEPYSIYTVVLWFGAAALVAPVPETAGKPLATRVWRALSLPVLLVSLLALWITFSYSQKMIAIKSGQYSTEEQLQMTREAARLCPPCDFPYLHRAFIFARRYEQTGNGIFRNEALRALADARQKTSPLPDTLFIEGILLELGGDFTGAMERYLRYYRVGQQPDRVFEALERIRKRKQQALQPSSR